MARQTKDEMVARDGSWEIVRAPDGRYWRRAERGARCSLCTRTFTDISARFGYPEGEAIYYPTTTGLVLCVECLRKHVALYDTRPRAKTRGIDPPPSPTLDEAMAQAAAWSYTIWPRFENRAEGNARRIKHMQREVVELSTASHPHDAFEMADLLILLARHADENGIDLAQAVMSKLAINKQRAWGAPDAEGVVEHRRDGPEQEQ